MNISDKALVQVVISFMEHQLEHVKAHAAIDYLRQRIGYFQERYEGLNTQISTSLLPCEIAELHFIATEYCYALQGQNNNDYAGSFYVATANQVRDRLGEMRNG